MNALLDELDWRGLLAESTDRAALAAHLDAQSVRAYVGFDPTAPSIHMGNLVQLMLMRHLQRAGHRPILLVGGSTGLVGDPKGAGERAMNPADLVHGWAERIHEQVRTFVDFEGPAAAIMANNYDWTADVGVLDFLRDIGKHFSVNRMLDRQLIRDRLESGISYAEFSYVLLQSFDYLQLYRRYGCTLQTGATDQWGNITAGVELIRRAEGARVHALVTPLLTKADGTKFGKTESGTVWLDPTMTSPYAFHQFFLNTEDAMVGTYLRVFSERSHEEIEALDDLTAEEPQRRAAQRALADDITDLVHSVAEREAAVRAAAALFGQGELRDLDSSTLRAAVDELKPGELAVAGDEWPGVVDALVASRVVDSRGAARRAIAEGGAYVNNVRVGSADDRLGASDLLDGRWVLVRRGRKTVGAVRVHR